MGNGFPVSAAFTRAEIADGLGQGKVEYFNTVCTSTRCVSRIDEQFGGNPVACSAVLAVLDIIEKDGLQAHAAVVGDYFLAELRKLQAKHGCIGDVRCVHVCEIMKISQRPRPLHRRRPGRRSGNARTARRTRLRVPDVHAQALQVRGAYLSHVPHPTSILLNSEGPHANIVKIKPPMPFTKANVDEVVEKLDATLSILVK